MQFHDTTEKQGMVQHANFLVGTDNDNYTIRDKVRSANNWVKKVAAWIWQAVPDWEFDDVNYSTLPIAERDLVDDQEDYALPTNVYGVHSVEILDSNGDYRKLKSIDRSQIRGSFTEYRETKGIPVEYDLLGNSLVLKPAPDLTQVTESNGLRLTLSRETDVFDSSSTTKEAGFNEMHHEIVPTGMALDYAVKTGDIERMTTLKRMLYGDPNVREDNGMKGDLQDHYSHRHNRGFKTRLRPKRRPSNV